jgi:ubiquinone/menaquinone biosynthesis C-methylase UbiE
VGDVYTHGHHEAVLRSHRWRTVENSARYLLPELRSGRRLLDVGCGPGTLTLDLARHVAPGDVVGVDIAADVLEEASGAGDRAKAANVRFEVGDVYGLTYQDESFDIVHAHQLLQHLSDPVRALVEMRRVLRDTGALAVRDGDYGAFVWSPPDPHLDRWLELYHEVTARNRAQADAGRHLLAWVTAAGFRDATFTSSTWTFADTDSRQWWADLWAERVEHSAFADQALSYGLSDRAELAAMAASWRAWAEHSNGVFIVVHGEVLAHR